MNSKYPMVSLGKYVSEEKEQIGASDGECLPVLGVANRDGIVQTGIAASQDKSRYLHLKPNRFAYNPYRINVGSIGLSTQDQEGIVSPAYVVFKTKDQLDSKFLYRFLKSHEGNHQINFHGNRGTVRSALRFADLCNIAIPLPSLSEQQRIVARIETLAAKIDEAQFLRHQADEQCETFCRAVLLDKSHGEFKPTPMRELVTLRECDVVVSPDQMYNFAGVYCFGRGLFRGNSKTGLEFTYTRLTRLRQGNFVYPKLMAWEGALGIVPPECNGLVVSPEFPVFEVNEDRIYPEVLDVYFRTPSVWPLLSGVSTGTNIRRRRLNSSDFLAFKMPLPTMETQRKLREVKRLVERSKKLQAQSTIELNVLLPTILNMAFKGGLD